MRSVLVAGVGKMGRTIVRELLATTQARLTLVDLDVDGIEAFRRTLIAENRAWSDRLEGAAPIDRRPVDAVVLAAPWTATKHHLAELMPASGRAEMTVVSITRPDYADLAWLHGVTDQTPHAVYLPIGLEPGLVELLCAAVARAIPDLSQLVSYCGGIPRSPRLPLCHALMFGERIVVDDRDAW